MASIRFNISFLSFLSIQFLQELLANAAIISTNQMETSLPSRLAGEKIRLRSIKCYLILS